MEHESGAPRRAAAIRELSELVIGYLRERPDASDTLAGIAEWWVVRQRLRVDLANLQNALSLLVEQGVLEEVRTGDHCRYRLLGRPFS